MFRASVGLRVALLHEMGAEASFGREGGREEAGRRMRSAIQCARQTRDLVRVERARNVDAEWHARYIFIYIFFFFFFFFFANIVDKISFIFFIFFYFFISF